MIKRKAIRDCILLILESTGQPYGAELELANNVLCGWVIREAVTEPKTTSGKNQMSHQSSLRPLRLMRV